MTSRTVVTAVALIGTVLAVATGHDIGAMVILLALFVVWMSDD